MAIETALVLFNRDLRVHDHPALTAAAKAERTVPLFVLDERLLGSRFAAPNRVANNAGNWQCVAGTGNDTRPNRVLNPVRQAERFDPEGDYVRRYLPELESLRGRDVFRPWLSEGFRRLDYPEPIVDHDEAAAAFKARRGA